VFGASLGAHAVPVAASDREPEFAFAPSCEVESSATLGVLCAQNVRTILLAWPGRNITRHGRTRIGGWRHRRHRRPP